MNTKDMSFVAMRATLEHRVHAHATTTRPLFFPLKRLAPLVSKKQRLSKTKIFAVKLKQPILPTNGSTNTFVRRGRKEENGRSKWER